MPTVIVPVGLNMGQDFSSGNPAEHPSEFWEVHLGTESASLTPDEVRVWGAAFLDPQRHASHEFDRAHLEDLLRQGENGMADPAPVVDRLLERGLLLEYDTEAASWERLFGGMKLFPLVQGLGNSPEEPAVYQIGIAGEPIVSVNANVYAIWSYSLASPSLWQACTDLAEGIDEGLEPGQEPFGYTPDGVAGEVGAAIPVLVAGGCAFLDPLNYTL
ncbi:MAG TPA: hypothetical protein VF053_16010 [Streptosporangiales bacterium]